MMALTVAELVAKLGLDASEFDKGMDQSKKKAMTWGEGVQKAQKAAAVGLVAVTGLIVGGVKAYGDLTSSIGALQRQTKISAEDASLLVGEWQRYGVSIEQGTTATVMLSKGMETAQAAAAKTQTEIAGLDKGSKTYADQLSTLQAKLVDNSGAFGRLGISFQEIATLSPADMLEEVRQKLSDMPAGAERTAIAAKLLGRGFQGLSKWINASKGDLSAVDQQIKDTGQVMSTSELAKAKDDAKKMAELQLQWRGFMVEVGRAAMPAMEKLIPALKRLLEVVRPLAPHLVEIAGALAGFLVVTKAAQGFTILVAALHTLKGLVVGGKLASGLAGVVSAAGGGGFVTTAGGETVAQTLLTDGGSNVVSAGGISAAGKGNAALTASSLGGTGVSIAGPAMIALAAATIAAGTVYLSGKAADKEAATGGGFWDQLKAGLWGPFDWAADTSGLTALGDRRAKQSSVADRLASMPKTPQSAYLKADYLKALDVPQVKAAIELDTPQTRAQLAGIRAAIVENLDVPIKEATELTQLIFPQSWAGRAKSDLKAATDELANLKATLKKKIAFGADTGPTVAAIKGLESRIAVMRARVARPAHTGHLDTSSWTGAINLTLQQLREFRDLASAGITPGSVSQHKRWTAANVAPAPAWHPPGRAAGGYAPARAGGTAYTLGEGGEGEYIIPESKMGGGDIHVHIGTLVGTDERAARQLSDMVGRHLMRGVRRGLVGQNA